MKKILIMVFLIIISMVGYSACEIPELKKFERKTENSIIFHSEKKEKISIDVTRLMRKTIMVESECNPKIKHPVAKGIAQIEPATFKSMSRDKNFAKKFNEIEKKYGVNLKKNWATDTYTNIVAAYAVYHWKLSDTPEWWDRRRKFTQLKKNYSDKEWNLYKIYYNSIAGKTTLYRWNQFKV